MRTCIPFRASFVARKASSALVHVCKHLKVLNLMGNKLDNDGIQVLVRF